MSNLLIKREEETSNDFGTIPEKRTISELLDKGFIVIDKDAGPTSHQEVDFLKKILEIDKAGHSGTLDPQVTGVLVTGLGRATRLMEYMLKSNKEYVCLLYLHSEIEESKIRDAFKTFTGKIIQLPPIVSAVKRQEREREIYENKILDIRDNKYVLFKCKCQHGTYIRKLCSDIALSLSVGGQMIELRRTKAGPFTEDDNSIGLDKLRNLYDLYKENNIKYETQIRKYIKPMEDLLCEFKKVYVRDSAVYTLAHGFNLAIPGISKLDDNISKGEEIAVFTLKGELVAMGTALMSAKEITENKNGMCVSIEKVFMDINEYPNLNPVQK